MRLFTLESPSLTNLQVTIGQAVHLGCRGDLIRVVTLHAIVMTSLFGSFRLIVGASKSVPAVPRSKVRVVAACSETKPSPSLAVMLKL